MTNLETVKAIYEAFGRGDVSDILARVSDDVSWEEWATPGRAQELIPYLRPRNGRPNVAGFLGDVAATLEFHSFEPVGFFESRDHVLVRIRFDATIRTTGRRFQDEEIHLWGFDKSGRVAEFRHYVDTLKHVEALTRSEARNATR